MFDWINRGSFFSGLLWELSGLSPPIPGQSACSGIYTGLVADIGVGYSAVSLQMHNPSSPHPHVPEWGGGTAGALGVTFWNHLFTL